MRNIKYRVSYLNITRRCLAVFLAALIAFGVLFAASAEDAEAPEHIPYEDRVSVDQCPGHEFYTVPIFYGTCSATGLGNQYCEHCQFYKVGVVLPIDPDFHLEKHLSDKLYSQATCVEPQYSYQICSDCGQVVNKTPLGSPDPTAHKSDGKWYDVTPATCLSDGIRANKCSLCGAYFNYTTEPAGETHHVAAQDAEWQIAKAPDCRNPGRRVKYCIYCGEVAQSEEIPSDPNAHVFPDEYTVDRPATCVDAGSQSRHCEVCGARTDITAIPVDPDAHSFTGKYYVETAATCSTTGLESTKCVYCGAAGGTRVIPPDPSAHVWGDWVTDKEATCTEGGMRHRVCNYCGTVSVKEATSPAPHNFADYKVISVSEDQKSRLIEYTCTVCGEKMRQIRPVGEEELVPSLKLTEDSKYVIDPETGYITGVAESTDVRSLMENFVSMNGFTVRNPAGAAFDSYEAVVGTGSTMRASNDNGSAEYRIVVRGDVSGDGRVLASDARLVLRASARLETLVNEYFAAADLNLDGELAADDARKILRKSAGLE